MDDVEQRGSLFGGVGEEGGALGFLSRWQAGYLRRFQMFADRVTPHMHARWAALAVLMLLFFARIYVAHGYYIVCYALFIYLLNHFIHFLTPKSDPESDGPILPQSGDDEFRPFLRKLPEFKFWWSCTRATLIAFAATAFSVFDVPVYWPILLVYFIVLFAITMKKEIQKWYKLGYVPWNRGKPKYVQ